MTTSPNARTRRGAPTFLTADATRRFATVLLWVGACMPFIYSSPNTIDQVGGLGPIDVVRGVGPTIALIAATLLARPIRRLHFGITEAALAAFLGVTIASGIWSYSPQVTIMKTVPLLFSYLCCLRIVRMTSDRSDVLRQLVGACHVVLIAAIIEWVTVPSLVFAGSPGDPTPRFQTIVPGIATNLLGLVAAVGLAGIALKIGPRWSQKPVFSVALFIGYIAILIGGRSRVVSLLALLLTVIAALGAMHRARINAAIGWFGIGLGFCCLAFVLQSTVIVQDISDYILRGQDAQNIDTLTGRTVIWQLALDVWHHHAFTGFGYYAGHRLALPSFYSIFENYSNVDNTWIETLVDVGYIGVVPLALYALSGIFRALFSKESRLEKVLMVGITLTVAALSFVNPSLQSPSSTLVIFAVIVIGREQPIRLASSPKMIIDEGSVNYTRRCSPAASES